MSDQSKFDPQQNKKIVDNNPNKSVTEQNKKIVDYSPKSPGIVDPAHNDFKYAEGPVKTESVDKKDPKESNAIGVEADLKKANQANAHYAGYAKGAGISFAEAREICQEKEAGAASVATEKKHKSDGDYYAGKRPVDTGIPPKHKS